MVLISRICRILTVAAILASAVSPVGTAGCADDNQIDWSAVSTGLSVGLLSVGGKALDSVESPLPVPDSGVSNGIDAVIDIRALGGAGGDSTLDRDMWVRLSVRPGKLTVVSADRYVGNDVFLKSGSASGVKVRVWDVFGPTRIWAEDIGFVPRTKVGVKSACEDGRDNDADGPADYPSDTGCLSAMDDSEEPGTGAAGVTRAIAFDTPSLGQLQGFSQASPFVGESVPVESGSLVVTRVTTDGMYVTDTANPGNRGYNHLFVYTFNSPTTKPVCNADEFDSLNCSSDAEPLPLRVCDRLTHIVGTITEFYGFTEMGFPSWDTLLWDPDREPCPVPAPVELSAGDFRGNGTAPMESYEAGLVRVSNVRIGTAADIVDCDFNKDGTVDFRDYDTNECSTECQCRESCNDDPLCLEINQYWAYGQWPALLGGDGGVKVWISTRQSVPEFDPYAEGMPTELPAITGTLRNLSFLDPYPWIIEPRCEDDITRAGVPPAASSACVIRRSGDQDGNNQ